MTDWATFAGFVGVVLALLLLLAHATQHAVETDSDEPQRVEHTDLPGDVDPDPTVDREGGAGTSPDLSPAPSAGVPETTTSLDDLSTTALLANVAVTQGVFLGILVIAVWYTGVPTSVLGAIPGASVPGAGGPSLELGPAVALGAGLGLLLYVLNEVGAAVGDRIGLGSSEALREALAPESSGGWAVLLFVVLPTIAGFEELLFRGVLIGALTVGLAQTGLEFGLATPWLLAVGSSAAFALGHGAQGHGGVVVTGLLGLALAGAFVLTWSLPLVFVAHYLVNALEFLVHEYVGVDPV